MPVQLKQLLQLDRCPHCSVARPHLGVVSQAQTNDQNGRVRFWRVYQCNSCSGLVTAASTAGFDQAVTEMYPQPQQVSDEIPEPARTYLSQSAESLHAPSGAIMLAASSVDAMLKAKGYKKGSLYERIDQAAAQHLITADMALWAHDVRLDANEQRHADENAPLPGQGDAQRCIDFVRALGDILFALPARVERGRKAAQQAGAA